MTYHSVALLFVALQMLVGEAIFIWRYPKRSYFWLRFLLSSAVCLLIAFFYNTVVQFFTGSAELSKEGRVVQCIVILAATIAVFMISFKLKFKIVLSLCCSGYVLQHLIYQISMIFHSLPLGDGFSQFITNNHRIVENVIFVIFYALFILVFGKKVARCDFSKNYNNLLNFISIFVILVCVILSLYAGKSEIAIYVSMYAIICCALALVLQFAVLGMTRLNNENESIRRKTEQDIARYESVKDAVEFINIKCHDLKKELNLLKDSVSIEQLENLKSTIEIYDNIPHTGNVIIDNVILNAVLTQSQNKVQFTFSGNGAWLDFVDDSDLKSLFMNLISNAADAVVNADPDKRSVSVVVEKRGDIVFIAVRNYYVGAPVEGGRFPDATKRNNDGEHGFGLKSMQMVAKKYGGEVKVSSSGEIFIAEVYLFNKN